MEERQGEEVEGRAQKSREKWAGRGGRGEDGGRGGKDSLVGLGVEQVTVFEIIFFLQEN